MDARIDVELPVDDEAARFPHLSAAGRAMVRFLAEHPHAPLYRNTSGHRLAPEDLAPAREYLREAVDAAIDWRPGERPAWTDDAAEHCFRDVPFWRRLGDRPRAWEEISPITRADLSRDIAQFVPDHIPPERLIHYSTSGTTGDRLLVPSHPLVASRYLAFHLRALRRFGIEPRARRGEVGLVLLGMQQKCFTYVSVTPLLDESGLAKINLHPNDWRDPADRARYLDALKPEVIAGDPISFDELLRLDLRHRPRAILSTAMTLLAGLRARLEERFGCPVLDLYSMNEAGPIGVFDAARGGHVLLQHRLFIEILDARGQAVAPGARGEITLTGGFNFCLPLLRYRTGDFASLELRGGELVLVGLEGRPPVRFRTAAGAWVNNVDVTHVLAPLALPRFALHQRADGSLRLRVPPDWVSDAAIMETMARVFGATAAVGVEPLAPSIAGEKTIQYTSELAEEA